MNDATPFPTAPAARAHDAPTALAVDPVTLRRPRSAVSAGVGLAGMVVIVGWAVLCRHWSAAMALIGQPSALDRANGPAAALTGVALVGLVMALWSLAIDRVHRRPSTGLAEGRRRPWRAVWAISGTKLLGLYATWMLVAVGYMLCRWFWLPPWHFAMEVIATTAPVAVLLAVPWTLWHDRRLLDPRDGAWVFGRWILGREGADPQAIRAHLMAWLVKGFFGAFMLSILPASFATVINDAFYPAGNPAAFCNALIDACFLVDVSIGLVGYALTVRVLDAGIRSVQPRLDGWVAALICYPPFVLMGDGGPLDYHHGTASWFVWLQWHPVLVWAWGGWLVLLTALYALATVAFGPRFSNLTRRGTITHGVYRLTRHPAYVSKNLFWWSATLPFLAASGSWLDAVRNTAVLAAVSGVYWWRARTEEAHLLAEDADYRAYYAWAGAHAPVTRGLAWVVRVVVGK